MIHLNKQSFFIMYRYRRYRRRFPTTVRKVKYSNETMNCVVTFDNPAGASSAQQSIPLVPLMTTQGMRKCKNFTLTIASQSTQVSYIYAVVYVPEGTDPTALHVGSSTNPVSLYEPNQNVIMAGCINSGEGVSPVRNFTRLSRNLNSNDQLYLCIIPSTTYAQATRSIMTVTFNYAICYS